MSQRMGGWDVHTHIVPPAVVAAGERGTFGMRANPGTLTICAHGVPLRPLSNIGKLVDRVRSDDLDGAIVSVSPPLFRPDLGPEECGDYARLVNDGLLEACHEHANVLRPLAYLPVEAPEIAVRIVAEPDDRWAGAVMGTVTGAITYGSERLDPLWRMLAERNLPLFIHPGSTPDQRLEKYYLSNLLSNPVETTMAAANLVFAGVMHRFLRLNIILAHGGGRVAALCGRWQRGSDTERPGIPSLAPDPIEAVRRFYVDSLTHFASFLKAVIEVVGENRVLLGSDWPFPIGASCRSRHRPAGRRTSSPYS